MTDLNGWLKGTDIIMVFFKLFSLVFSLMFLVYIFVIYRQVRIMLKTIQVNDAGPLSRQNLISLISLLLFFYGLFILLIALIVLIS